MTHPRRKLTTHTVRAIRRDYRARRTAEQLIAEGRAILKVTPTAMDWARDLGVTQNIVLSAAQCLTYKDVTHG